VRIQGAVVFIDCGKRWYDQTIGTLQKLKLPAHAVRRVLLTHSHADAANGIDDLRGFRHPPQHPSAHEHPPIEVYAAPVDLKHLSNTFGYLFDSSKATGSGHVALLNWKPLPTDMAPVPLSTATDERAAGAPDTVDVVAVPVDHGPNCVAQSFYFPSVQLLYMSDVKSVLPASLAYLQSVTVDLLVIDCTFRTTVLVSHVNWEESIAIVKQIKPRRVTFTGLTHDFEFAEFDAGLRARNLWGTTLPPEIEFIAPYDGIELPLNVEGGKKRKQV
jgi:ribonuclease BN (tRNA processing enzyme)